ncbi:cytochrome P450 [Pisolithus marmoratus]|nr:cytochrome P450 [Pisolithus marmoratus]
MLTATNPGTSASNTILLRVFYHDFPKFRSVQAAVVGFVLFFSTGLYFVISRKWKQSKLSGLSRAYLLPPVIDIPVDEVSKQTYESALKEYGSVIGIRRKGTLEYIVDESLTKEVLSNDQDFSFERGTARLLNLPFILPLSKGKFFKDVHTTVVGGTIPRMDKLVDKIFPIFERQAHRIVKDSQLSGKGVDLSAHVHRCIAEAMLIIILGENFLDDHTLRMTEETAHAIPNMAGMYPDPSPFARWFPKIWNVITWVRLVVEVIILQYCWVIVPIIWKEIRARKYQPLNSHVSKDNSERERHNEPLIHYIAGMYADTQGRVSIASAIWVFILIIAFIFASVQQTAASAVWVIFELSIRKEYLPSIGEELSTVADSIDSDGIHRLSYDSLCRSHVLDSFVREVLRTRVDSLDMIRETTRDVLLGGYTIPKGPVLLIDLFNNPLTMMHRCAGNLVRPMATLTNHSKVLNGENAAQFDPTRWLEGPASSTVSSGYLTFGYGRWACPGRILAVTGMFAIKRSDSISVPEVEGGECVVADPLNMMSLPPIGH